MRAKASKVCACESAPAYASGVPGSVRDADLAPYTGACAPGLIPSPLNKTKQEAGNVIFSLGFLNFS